MRRLVPSTLLAACLLLPALAAANPPSEAVLSTEGGQPFYVVLNGMRLTPEPVTTFRLEALDQPGYKLKIIFADTALGELDKNLYVNPGNRTTYSIKQGKRGWKLAYVSDEPLGGAAAATASTSVDMNVGGLGMDVSVSASTTTTTTTTTTTVHSAPAPQAADCSPVGGTAFEEMKASVKSKSFSDSKMTIAKQITKANCLTSAQVAALVALFDFESDRLDYAKFAYDYVADRANYSQVNDVFEFESTIEELGAYIAGR